MSLFALRGATKLPDVEPLWKRPMLSLVKTGYKPESPWDPLKISAVVWGFPCSSGLPLFPIHALTWTPKAWWPHLTDSLGDHEVLWKVTMMVQPIALPYGGLASGRLCLLSSCLMLNLNRPVRVLARGVDAPSKPNRFGTVLFEILRCLGGTSVPRLLPQALV